jgi:DNA processing protein
MSKPVTPDSLIPGRREDELAATVALIRSEVFAAAELGAVIDEFGSAVRLVQLSETDRLFVPWSKTHQVIGAVTPDDIGEAIAETASWRERNLDVRSLLDAEYPLALHEIFNRPPLMFVRGAWPAQLAQPAVAVVGTRKATADGVRRARRLAGELADAGVAILSGLAAGIDTMAHESALEHRGVTAAVMGTGIERVYPEQNAALAERIVGEGGALLSQFFPEQTPARWTFPMRNVVMSGLAMATVVIEASETSGARMQARVALQHGRTVFLLRSLVQSHEWAARYVNEGAYGAHAIEITTTGDILDHLASQAESFGQLAVA